MAQAPARAASVVRLFDAHCHLQDPRLLSVAPSLIRAATAAGVARFAVNGTSEKDWHLVKQMAEEYPSVVPCFGLHPWWVPERSPDWMDSLRRFFAETPEAAVGEIGLDKGSHGKTIDFGEQVEVFQQQLELAKELNKPVSVHCVRAFGDLLEILKRTGPFPAGVLLHSYLGSAEMVSSLEILGCYFSLSGFLTGMKSTKAKKMLKSMPLDRILLETDAPDALPKLDDISLLAVPVDSSSADNGESKKDSNSRASTTSNESLNHPSNIHIVMKYVASLLEISEIELAEVTYKNATKLFSYHGSKVHNEVEAV
ncbi:hypothetical protein OsI_17072 [Oryza sativa Indica Group]|uniref:Uncharacterized protein n=2 Tax=Oryza sativa TaxID=4530 RepID=B8ATE4_ORYSI|nr:hypothetical protein OsI_17072 [Oryza sativa Indica Group]CAH66729.1 H0404F02.5 [Oryza sativa]